jgi:hypothetical protein
MGIEQSADRGRHHDSDMGRGLTADLDSSREDAISGMCRLFPRSLMQGAAQCRERLIN